MPLPTGFNCHFRDDPSGLLREGALRRIRTLYESDHYSIRLTRCTRCHQVYLACYVEVFDDSWSFYAPVSDEEAARVESAEIQEDSELVKDLVTSRPHIVWPPFWKPGGLYWNEGPETALSMGARPW